MEAKNARDATNADQGLDQENTAATSVEVIEATNLLEQDTEMKNGKIEPRLELEVAEHRPISGDSRVGTPI